MIMPSLHGNIKIETARRTPSKYNFITDYNFKLRNTLKTLLALIRQQLVKRVVTQTRLLLLLF